MTTPLSLHATTASTASPALAGHTSRARPPSGFFAHHGVMAVGVRLLRAVDFRMKLLVVLLFFGVPIAFLGYYFVEVFNGQKTFTEQERRGVTYLRALFPAIRAAQDHRGLANRMLNGDAAARPALDAAHDKLTQAFDALAAVDARLGAALQSSSRLAELRGRQQGLRARLDGMTPAQSFAAHTELVSGLLALLGHVGKTSNLVLDPEAASFYVMQAVVLEGGPVLEAIASTRGMSAGILASKQITPAQRKAVAERVTLIRLAVERQREAVASAIEVEPSLRQRLAADDLLSLTDSLVRSIDTDLLGDAITAEPGPFWTAASRALDEHYATADRFLETLDALLADRITNLDSRLLTKALVTGGFFVLACYFLYAFYLVTRGGLAQLSDHIMRMAGGDFSARPWPWGKDEVAGSLDALRGSLASMSELLSAVRTQAEAVSHAADEIASGNRDLSGRTESSAAALEQSARGMEQLREQVSGTVECVGSADRGMTALGAEIERLNSSVTGLVQRMTALHAQSREMTEIISLIDGIAFQTNILALNASVEAARAGDMGRGFAVVAQEVRALAQRSAEAARQINGILKSSAREIEAGSTLAQSAGESVKATVSSAAGVAQSMRSVRDGASQQQQAVEQAATAINQLATATQGNAALVEEVAAATGSLAQSGTELNSLVARFRLGDGHAAPA